MKLIIKKIVFVLVVMGSINCPMYSIQQKTANFGTGCFALVTAIGSYQAWLSFHKKIHPMILGVTGTAFVSGMYYYLHSITPQGRLKRANKLLDELTRHTLIKHAFSDDKLFFDAVHDVYLVDDLPLISAYNHLIGLLPTIHFAFGLINKAAAQVEHNSFLEEECTAVMARAQEIFTNMSDAIKRVREHKDYLVQLQIYKEFLANEKQAVAQQQIADAHMQIAQAKQSSVLLEWLKALFWSK